MKEIREKVSWRVVDAWNAIPPCSYREPYCHVQCPYYYECNSPEEPSEDDERWEQYFKEKGI